MQTALVVVLFLGSLSTLLFNAFSPFFLTPLESDVRHRLREASRRMGETAAPLAGRFAGRIHAAFR